MLSYYILLKEDDKEWKEIEKLKSIDDSYKVKGLESGKKYKFAVVAENKVGRSEPMETSTAVELKKKPTKPSPPVGPIVFSDIQKKSVVISWKPSESDGGSPLLGYLIEMREESKSSWSMVTSVEPNITSYCVQRLKEKQEYFFRVFAENKVGKSEPLVSESVTIKSPIGKIQTLVFCRQFKFKFQLFYYN